MMVLVSRYDQSFAVYNICLYPTQRQFILFTTYVYEHTERVIGTVVNFSVARH